MQQETAPQEVLPPVSASVHPVTNHTAPSEHETSLLRAIMKTTFVPVSALLGLLVANTEVRGSANRKALTETTLKDIAEKQMKAKSKLQAERLAGKISKQEFQQLETEQLRNFRKAVDTRMKYMGYNFLNKFNYVARSDAQKAIIDGITVAGITIGALFAVGNSKSIVDFLSGDEEKEKRSR